MNGETVISNQVLDISGFSSITRFRADAFSGVDLISVKLPASASALSSAIFDGCIDLRTIEVPFSVRAIPDRAFRNCVSLTSLTIGSLPILSNNVLDLRTIRNIGDDSFSFGLSIQKIVFDCRNLFIGDFAFAECTNLREIELNYLYSGSLEVEEGSTPFYGDFSLRDIQYPGIVNCSQIVEILFSDLFAFTLIENETWSKFKCNDEYEFLSLDNRNHNRLIGCNSNTREVSIPAYIKIIGTRAFAQSGSTEVYFALGSQLTTLEPDAFDGSQVRIITFPPSLVELPQGFFAHSTVITDVIFEGNVTVLPNGTFHNATSLKFFSIAEIPIFENGVLDFRNSWVSSIGHGTFHLVQFRSVFITHTIEIQHNFEFSGHVNLTSVSLPVGTNEFPARMFSDCTSLQSISFGQVNVLTRGVLNLTSGGPSFIGNNCFQNVAINRILIGEGTAVQEYSFANIRGSLIFEVFSLNPLNYTTFLSVFVLTNVQSVSFNYVQIASQTTLDLSVFRFSTLPILSGRNYLSITLQSSLRELTPSVFQNSVRLEKVEIPAGIVKIPSNAFAGCPNLNFISIKFYDVLSAGVLDLSNGKFEVEDSAFRDVLSINKVIIGSNVLNDNSLSGLASLSEVQFSNVLFTFNGSPFNGDNSITSVNFLHSSDCSGSEPNDFIFLFGGSSLSTQDWAYYQCVDSQTSASSKSTFSAGLAFAFILVGIVVASIVIGLYFFFNRRKRPANEGKELFEELI